MEACEDNAYLLHRSSGRESSVEVSNLLQVGRGFPKGRESPFGLHEMVWVPRGRNALSVDGVQGRAKSP